MEIFIHLSVIESILDKQLTDPERVVNVIAPEPLKISYTQDYMRSKLLYM